MSARGGAKWIICPHCDGDGRVDSLGVVNRDDFDDGEFEQYLDGEFDTGCAVCGGSGKVREDHEATNGPVIVRTGSTGQRVVYRDADDASEHMLRMAEGWC